MNRTASWLAAPLIFAALAALGLAAIFASGCESVTKRPGLLELLLPPGATELTVVSYNVRYGTADDGPDAWENRREMLVAGVRKLDPDFLCVQEALDFQVEYLMRELGMASVGVGRDDGKLAGEFSAILYKSDKFAAESGSTFWFSNTPERPGSKNWGNTIPRICTFAGFVEPRSGRRFKIFNTHLDHLSEPSRNRSVELLARAMLDSRQLGVPVIVTGDFNAGPRSPAIRYMRGEVEAAVPAAERTPLMAASPASPRLVDTLVISGSLPSAGSDGTFHNFNGKTDGPRVDYVFTDKVIETSSAGIDHFSDSGRFPSDHFAVWAKLRLK